MDDINKSKLTAELQAQLEIYEQNEEQLKTLSDIAAIVQDISSGMNEDKQKKSMEKLGALLVDIRETLKATEAKEAPETPDFAKPVVDAVKKLEQALSASLKAIDVKPQVTVAAPNVNVDAPIVDLSKVEKVLSTLPKAFESAIKLIPKPEKDDYTPLLKAWEGISEQLESIDTASRLKAQFPGSMTISNLADITTQTDALTDAELRATPVEITGTVSTTPPVGGATSAKQDELLAELQQKTEPSDIQNVEMINALRSLLQAVSIPSWYDPSTNSLRVGTTAVTISSGTVTTVTNLTNFGTNAADVMARDTSINTWANVARRTIS